MMVKNCKILVVDDEFIMRQGIKHMLDWEQKGFEVIGEASNGSDALDFIEKNPPHIVISDIMMPKMDGIELAKIIQEKYPNIHLVILSSYSDFEYVKSCFQYGVEDYILKPSLNPTELLKILVKIARKIPDLEPASQATVQMNHLFNRLFLGFDVTIDFDYLRQTFPFAKFQIFGVDITKSCTGYSSQQAFIQSFTEQVESINCKNTLTQLVQIEQDTLLLILNFDPIEAPNLLILLKQIVATLSASYEDAFFVLTPKCNSIHELKDLYKLHFLQLIPQQFYNKGNHLLTSQEAVQPQDCEKFNFKAFSKLLSMVQITSAFEFLKDYVGQVTRLQCLSEFELKSLIQNALYNVITTLEGLEFNSSSLNALKLNYFEQIDRTKYITELTLTFNTILEDFGSIVTTYQKQLDSHIINKIVNYIYEHYDEPLALTDVAKKFNLNYFYLSSYFSSHNSEGFNEFLNKIRIEKASELLKQDIPISDISSMVGYSEHSYFCKVFKKFTGFTPSNFRKNSFKA